MSRNTGSVWKKSRRLGFSVLETGEELVFSNPKALKDYFGFKGHDLAHYLYEGNLMSFLNSNTVLLDYQDDDGIMRLNFNDDIMDGNDKLVEEVIYTISLSVFDNYPSEMVSFEVNGEVVGHVSRSDLNKY